MNMPPAAITSPARISTIQKVQFPNPIGPDERHADERAEHRHRPVREVDDAQRPEHEREAGGDEEEHGPAPEAGDDLHHVLTERVSERHRLVVNIQGCSRFSD